MVHLSLVNKLLSFVSINKTHIQKGVLLNAFCFFVAKI